MVKQERFRVCKAVSEWKGDGVTFLSPNKKVTKEVGLRGAECRAPARQSRPLKNPQARTWVLHSILTC